MSRIYLPPYLWVPPLGWEDPLEEGMATHSNILAWKTPCTEEPGRIQSMGLQRVRHDWATSLFFFLAQLLHWFAIFLRTVKSWHFALEAVYSLYHSLTSPTFPAFWLFAHSLLHWPPLPFLHSSQPALSHKPSHLPFICLEWEHPYPSK